MLIHVDALVLVTFALLWILALVLTRVFFKPVARILGERSKRIETAKAETEATLEAYNEDLRKVEEELKKARTASAEIWDQAELEALKERSRLVQDIQAECRAQVKNARRELERHVEELKKEIDGRTDEIATDIERRILN
jgi:F0F1-type ATP synthase membrane subunit b/b'